MPEGPDVIQETQYLKSIIKNFNIKSIKIISGRYTHEKMNGYDHIKKNNQYKIKDIDSKGKLIWFVLKDMKNNKFLYLVSTLGLTGKWSFEKGKSTRIKFVLSSSAKTGNDLNLYYTDQRNFGQINIYDDIDDLNKRIDKLAPDVLKANLTSVEMNDLISEYINTTRKKDLNLVKVLMDQEAIVSGIGNYLVAEILYDAKLNPHRDLKSLSLPEIKKLVKSIRYITKLSYYDNKTGYMENFNDFAQSHSKKVDKGIFPNYLPDVKIPVTKKHFSFKVYQQDEDPKGNPVVKDSILKDRTIHWVPNVQK